MRGEAAIQDKASPYRDSHFARMRHNGRSHRQKHDVSLQDTIPMPVPPGTSCRAFMSGPVGT